jgi:predicted small lipoprotein YifL
MQFASYFHSKWMAVLLLVLAGSSLLWIGCGKKGPPRPPRRLLPPAVKDLEYTVHNDMVKLSWTVPGKEGSHSAAPLATVKVFRSRMSAEDASCENCPIRFAVCGDIPVHKQRSEESKPIRMSYTEFVETGYHYIYKVAVFDENGIGGKDSNIVRFDH